MVDLRSKCPIQKLWQIFKSNSIQSFIFFEIPKYFFPIYFSPICFQFISHLLEKSKWKREFKLEKAPQAISSALAQRYNVFRPNPAREAAYYHFPHRCHRQLGPTC
jgi:hypothetical protein